MARSWTPGSSEFGRIDRGFVVNKPNFKPDEGGEARNHANAYLEDQDKNRVYMWVNDLRSDFSMAGTYAQSKKRRSFFPHNFVQPSMTISGQTPNQYQYNRIAEFVRKSQREVVQNDRRVLKFRCIATAEDTVRPIIKGSHQSISIDGYVQSMPRLAERWVNAPTFSFAFIVTYADKLLGLDDQIVRRVKFKSILDVIKNPGKYKFEEGGVYDPDRPNEDNAHNSTASSVTSANAALNSRRN